MARPIPRLSPENPGGRPPEYPWEEWTDGRPWEARQGEDFTVSPASFRKALARHAGRHGLQVHTRTIPGGVQFQFHPRV